MKEVEKKYRITEKAEVMELIKSNGWELVDLSRLLGVTVRCVQQHLAAVPVPFQFILRIYGLIWIKENVSRETLGKQDAGVDRV
jgi:hypothetical protein